MHNSENNRVMSEEKAIKTHDRIAVIGERDTILPFRALGLEIVPMNPDERVNEQVEKLLKEKVRIIFFTPDLFPHLQPIMERTRKSPVPCFIALPTAKVEITIERLRRLVAKAIGADLLFKKT
jgi:V/A-type H+-transporting ATPase subunit F